MCHETSPAATPEPAETAEWPELTEEERAELDRLDAEDRAKRAEDRAHTRGFARQMAEHIVLQLTELDPAVRKAVQEYLTGLHMVALWIDEAEAGEALDAREAAEAAARAEGGA